MNTLINENVLFVPGAWNGAIYDFVRNRIFSISHDANNLILRLIAGGKIETEEERDYITKLEKESLFRCDFQFQEYIVPVTFDYKLNFAWLEVTQGCNLRCVHCYEGEVHKSNAAVVLSMREWEKIIEELAYLNCPNIQFIGGEPSCYRGIISLMDYAGQYKFKSISFFTNATLITDEMIDCFKRNNVRLHISIYGHNALVHDSITLVNGSFDKTVANIKKLLANGITVSAAVIIMRENEEFYEKIVAFLKRLGIRSDKFDLVREVSGCKQNCHLATRKDLIEKKYRSKPKFSINQSYFNFASRFNTCWYGKLAITEDGNVLPCVFERNINYGNVRSASIKEILSSNELKHYWTMDYSQIDDCKECEYRFACKDCRPLGIVNGGIYKKSVRCLYDPQTGVWGNI